MLCLVESLPHDDSGTQTPSMLSLQGHCRKEEGMWDIVQGDVYGSDLEVTVLTCAHIPLARTRQWPCQMQGKLGNIIVPGLAAPLQQSFWPGKGTGIFDGHWSSLPWAVSGPAGHLVFLLSVPLCSKSAFSLFHPHFPGSSGNRWLVLTCTKT